ncbi:unnamed protein product [Musa acuminata subsp. malaccensis]|uniref:(wild Malaysian banana) hypothetical protein n=1 Tax=Musa acuminata subsp. malaccensis TaxID=214687 RepID=A0A804I9Z4_MUSAM|nr:unnamed protein product [Musa acuminata subsp. malaccensis]
MLFLGTIFEQRAELSCQPTTRFLDAQEWKTTLITVHARTPSNNTWLRRIRRVSNGESSQCNTKIIALFLLAEMSGIRRNSTKTLMQRWTN